MLLGAVHRSFCLLRILFKWGKLPFDQIIMGLGNKHAECCMPHVVTAKCLAIVVAANY